MEFTPRLLAITISSYALWNADPYKYCIKKNTNFRLIFKYVKFCFLCMGNCLTPRKLSDVNVNNIDSRAPIRSRGNYHRQIKNSNVDVTCPMLVTLCFMMLFRSNGI